MQSHSRRHTHSQHEFAALKKMRQRMSLTVTALPPGSPLAWPVLAAPLASTIKTEWMGDDKLRQLDVLVLWLPTSANLSWVMLRRLSMWNVSFFIGLRYSESRRDNKKSQRLSKSACCFLKAVASVNVSYRGIRTTISCLNLHWYCVLKMGEFPIYSGK